CSTATTCSSANNSSASRSREAPVIVCPNCGKENQDHYKFCLGCGAKLPAPGQAPAPAPPSPPSVPPPMVAPPAPQVPPPAGFGAPPPAPYPQPPQGVYGQPPIPAPPPYAGAAAVPQTPQPVSSQPPPYGSAAPAQPPASAAGPRPCPNCQTPNPPQFKFCGACGTPLEAAPPAAAPAPSASAAPASVPAHAPVEVAAKTMFIDASQRPAMAGGIATVRLVLLREDGTEGGVLVIEGGPETIGRSHGPPFDTDAYLSPEHAELTATREGLVIDDHGSLNGIFFKLEGRA